MTDSQSESEKRIESHQFNIISHSEMMNGDSIIRQALNANNLEPSAQIKVNELLYHWLSLPQTKFLVNDLVHDCSLQDNNDSSKILLENEPSTQGLKHGLSSTHGAMELEVKESEKRPNQYHVDERTLFEKHSLRKAAVAAASCDSHPPLSPCNSPDSPRYEKVTPNSGARRTKKGLGNKSPSSSSPPSSVKTKNTTNEIETKESPSDENVAVRDSMTTDYSIPRFHFPNNPRAQHQHTIEARRRCRVRRRTKSALSSESRNFEKNDNDKVTTNESKVGQLGDNERKLSKFDEPPEESKSAEETTTNDEDSNDLIFVKYLPEVRDDLLQIFDPSKNENSQGISLDDFAQVTKEFCGFPSFFAEPLAIRVHQLWNEKLGKEIDIDRKGLNLQITLEQFEHFWIQEMEPYDRFQRFFRLIKQQNNSHIYPEDFELFLNELLTFHPGLEFLQDTMEFQVTKFIFHFIKIIVNSLQNTRKNISEQSSPESCMLLIRTEGDILL